MAGVASLPAIVEPEVLRWARASIGLTAVAAARKLGVPDDRVEQWEDGSETPTIAQLRKAANVYKRPLAVFFLPEPPQDFDAMRDFRRMPNTTARSWSPELHGEYRRALMQREFALELYEVEEVEPPTTWKLVELPDEDDAIAEQARNQLLSNGPLRLSDATNAYDFLNVWIAALEESGILVLATARGSVSIAEMRAFSIYFDNLPVVMVNGSDGPRGRLFSVLHEYAHLLLHTGGLCDTVTETAATSADRRLEARCNAIAAAMLMPREDVLAVAEVRAREGRPDSWDYSSLRDAARGFGVSAEAFLLRLVSLGRTTMAFYLAQREEFLRAYEEEETRTRSRGGNWYRNTARDLGKLYVRRIADAHRRRVIDSYTAATYLNAKVGQIEKLAEAAALKESA